MFAPGSSIAVRLSQAIDLIPHGYEVVKKIGKGGFGSAYLVQSLSDKQLYVAKVIESSASDAAESSKEVEAIRKFKDPNVVQYVSHFFSPYGLVIVMEYCACGDLRSLLRELKERNEELPNDLVVAWLEKILLGLYEIHHQKILHRDLKSSNIFLTWKNPSTNKSIDNFLIQDLYDIELKLGDFGISKMIEYTLQQATTVVGTPQYMSPELCHSRVFTIASDMWSVGCILYELLTREVLYESSNLLQIVQQICFVEFDSQLVEAKRQEEVPKALISLLEQMLSKAPEKRPTCRDLLHTHPLFQRNNKNIFREKNVDTGNRSEDLPTPSTRSSPLRPGSSTGQWSQWMEGLKEKGSRESVSSVMLAKGIGAGYLPTLPMESGLGGRRDRGERRGEEGDIAVPFSVMQESVYKEFVLACKERKERESEVMKRVAEMVRRKKSEEEISSFLMRRLGEETLLSFPRLIRIVQNLMQMNLI